MPFSECPRCLATLKSPQVCIRISMDWKVLLLSKVSLAHLHSTAKKEKPMCSDLTIAKLIIAYH